MTERPLHDAENTGPIVDYEGNPALTPLVRASMYPWSDGTARSIDPTYGRIDRDLQWQVHDMLGGYGTANLARITAIENTLQEHRGRREPLRIPAAQPNSYEALRPLVPARAALIALLFLGSLVAGALTAVLVNRFGS